MCSFSHSQKVSAAMAEVSPILLKAKTIPVKRLTQRIEIWLGADVRTDYQLEYEVTGCLCEDNLSLLGMSAPADEAVGHPIHGGVCGCERGRALCGDGRLNSSCECD